MLGIREVIRGDHGAQVDAGCQIYSVKQLLRKTIAHKSTLISTQDKALTCLAKRSKAERALLILFAGLASILTIKKLAKNLRLLTSFTSFWSFYC